MKGKLGRVLGGAVLAVALFLAAQGAALALDADAWAKGLNGFGDAINAGKFDALLAGWTDDGVRIHPLLGEVKGKEGQRNFFKYLYDNFREQKLVVHRNGSQGNMIFVEMTWTATHKESGKKVSLDELTWFEVAKDGRIVRMRQYFDSAAFLKQLE